METNLNTRLTGKEKFLIIQSSFNDFITDNLLKGALRCFEQNGVKKDNLTIYKVPGAFELAVTADKLLSSHKYNAVICLGAIIKGETPHFEYISSAAAHGIMNVSIKHSCPVIFGVLTTGNVEHALARCGEKEGNKGWEAALTALEMTLLFNNI